MVWLTSVNEANEVFLFSLPGTNSLGPAVWSTAAAEYVNERKVDCQRSLIKPGLTHLVQWPQKQDLGISGAQPGTGWNGNSGKSTPRTSSVWQDGRTWTWASWVPWQRDKELARGQPPKSASWGGEDTEYNSWRFSQWTHTVLPTA